MAMPRPIKEGVILSEKGKKYPPLKETETNFKHLVKALRCFLGVLAMLKENPWYSLDLPLVCTFSKSKEWARNV